MEGSEMKQINTMRLSLTIFFILISYMPVLAWDNKVSHRDLSKYAADSSILRPCNNTQDQNCNYLTNLGFSAGLLEILEWDGNSTIKKGNVENWIQEGADLEDTGNLWNAVTATARWKNHFHNPLKPWLEAGLTDVQTGESSILWAQDGSNQQNYLERDWSWSIVRNYYYLALTSVAAIDRSAYFAQAFRGLGHQMHLIQDASQPAHVRNDAHPWDRNEVSGLNIEPWAAKNRNFINSLAANPQFPTLSLAPSTYSSLDPSYNSLHLTPVALFIDTDQYNGSAPTVGLTQGIAEYTNANFASEHTIFAEENPISDIHYFPYPRKSSTDIQDHINQNKLPETVTAEDGIPDTSFWIKKTGDGETYDHFARPAYLSNLLAGNSLFTKTFYQDDECHKDYARFLIPRAVGYSAALINYFFRGTLNIWTPESGVFSTADGSKSGSRTPYTDIDGNKHQEFTKIDIWIENTTPNDEAIGAGTMTAVARYKVIPNYASDLSNYPPNPSIMKKVEYSYSVSQSVPVNPGDIIPGYITRYIFNFENNPIPAGITDLTLQIVFKGTLGNETDNAVAVGMRDLSEPTHLTFWNSSDMFDLQYGGSSYSLYTFSTLTQMANADTNLFHTLDFNNSGSLLDDPILQPFDSTFTISFSDGSNWVPATTVDIPPTRYIRLIALVDPDNYNYVNIGYTFQGGSYSAIDHFNGVVNQADSSGLYPTLTPVKTFRKSLSASGDYLPFYQHFTKTIFGCYPVQVYDVNGNGISCPYAEDTAQPVPDPTPVPFTSDLNP